MDWAVWAEDLRKVYRSRTLQRPPLEAVRGISFQIPYGECFGFLGPNGAGKTTTLKMIHCVLEKSSGKLEVLGKEADVRSRDIKKRLGVVPQEDSLDPDLTLFENLFVYGNYYSYPKERLRKKMAWLLDYFSLRGREKSRIRELSGGEKRRLTIARGLIGDPELLVLDEPTTGLDPAARQLIWEKLKGLRAQGTTILLTTHYMEEATRLCDRVALMDSGRILFLENPRKLVEQELGRITVQVSVPKELRETVREYLEKKTLRHAELEGGMLIFPKEREDLTPLRTRISFEEWHEMPANLEHLFLYTVGRQIAS